MRMGITERCAVGCANSNIRLLDTQVHHLKDNSMTNKTSAHCKNSKSVCLILKMIR
jgi:hypothetical protein